MLNKKGLFISFEGGEGSGKTTQINRLASYLNDKNIKVVSTREPGGTDEAEKIRELLVKRDGGNWNAEAEVLMLYAARSMHIERVIKPALEGGKVVITDRFSDSTIAYQGYGHGYDLDKIKHIDELICSEIKPSLTFILDIDPEEGIKRSTRRLAGEELGFNRLEDRFEQLDISFHEKLRQGFLKIAENDKERCHVIDASASLDDVTAAINAVIDKEIER